ncbi:unnamed protein product [Durusdinium trenchii]|uniref:Uncharacterized protein n=1 Tax=Durusdinium trenchii TaxID=1381693 RepID=A0ABP0HJ15_9DINO
MGQIFDRFSCGRRARAKQRAAQLASETCQEAVAEGKSGYEVARLAAEAAQQAVIGLGMPYSEVAAVAFKAAAHAAKETSMTHALLGIASEAAGKAAMASGATVLEAALCAGEVAAAEAILAGSLACFAAEQAGEAAAQAALAAGAGHAQATKAASEVAASVAKSAARRDGASEEDAGVESNASSRLLVIRGGFVKLFWSGCRISQAWKVLVACALVKVPTKLEDLACLQPKISLQVSWCVGCQEKLYYFQVMVEQSH